MRAHHVGIVVADLERSKAFYSALGFEPVSEMGDEARTICFLELGDFRLELFCYTETPPALTSEGRVLGFRHLALETQDIERTLVDLKAAGLVAQDAKIREVPGLARLLFFDDPDGIEIEVMQEV